MLFGILLFPYSLYKHDLKFSFISGNSGRGIKQDTILTKSIYGVDSDFFRKDNEFGKILKVNKQ